jgi:hypothetical protein
VSVMVVDCMPIRFYPTYVQFRLFARIDMRTVYTFDTHAPGVRLMGVERCSREDATMGRFSSQAAIDTMKTDAFTDGFNDGVEWDLDGYDGDARSAAADEGFDAATINALGSRKCAARWGVDVAEGEEWEEACAAYSAGVRAGLLSRVETTA